MICCCLPRWLGKPHTMFVIILEALLQHFFDTKSGHRVGSSTIAHDKQLVVGTMYQKMFEHIARHLFFKCAAHFVCSRSTYLLFLGHRRVVHLCHSLSHSAKSSSFRHYSREKEFIANVHLNRSRRPFFLTKSVGNIHPEETFVSHLFC